MRPHVRNNVNVYTTRPHVPSTAVTEWIHGLLPGLTRGVDVTRAKRPGLAGFGIERVPPDAPGVVRQKVDRDRRLRRGRAHAMDVVLRRDQRVEVAGLERAQFLDLDC